MYVFCAGRGIGTATFDAKLLQQLFAMRDMVLHANFLDLRKAYDALYMYRCLDILVGCGVGTRTLRILQT